MGRAPSQAWAVFSVKRLYRAGMRSFNRPSFDLRAQTCRGSADPPRAAVTPSFADESGPPRANLRGAQTCGKPWYSSFLILHPSLAVTSSPSPPPARGARFSDSAVGRTPCLDRPRSAATADCGAWEGARRENSAPRPPLRSQKRVEDARRWPGRRESGPPATASAGARVCPSLKKSFVRGPPSFASRLAAPRAGQSKSITQEATAWPTVHRPNRHPVIRSPSRSYLSALIIVSARSVGARSAFFHLRRRAGRAGCLPELAWAAPRRFCARKLARGSRPVSRQKREIGPPRAFSVFVPAPKKPQPYCPSRPCRGPIVDVRRLIVVRTRRASRFSTPSHGRRRRSVTEPSW